MPSSPTHALRSSLPRPPKACLRAFRLRCARGRREVRWVSPGPWCAHARRWVSLYGRLACPLSPDFSPEEHTDVWTVQRRAHGVRHRGVG